MSNDKPKVGVLALTLEFYERSGPQTREGREKFVRERLLPALDDVADVRFEGAVFRREDVERTVAKLEADGAEVLLVILLTYSTSLSTAPMLQTTRLPIVVWNTQELFAVDGSYGSKELTANHGVHGTFDLCNVLVRAGVPFDYVTSHVDDPDAVTQLGRRLRTAAGVQKLRQMRLGLMGYPFPGMGDFGLDTTHLAMTLGCAWEALSVADFNRRAAAVGEADSASLVATYREEYELAPDVTEEDLRAAARAEVALRSLVDEYRLDAYSYQFLTFGDHPETETLPFVAASRLLADGIGFGGEGDLISAAFSALLNYLQPPATFSEIFTIDFAGNAALLSHMGEANVAMARSDRKVRLVGRDRSLVPTTARQLNLTVSYEPGPATMAALTLVEGGRWRIIASLVDLLDFPAIEGLNVPNAKIAPKGDIREFLTAYATAGGPHHLGLCRGDARDLLSVLAKSLSADYVEI
jgi:L-arabinose isomerase